MAPVLWYRQALQNLCILCTLAIVKTQMTISSLTYPMRRFGIITESPKMLRLFNIIEAISGTATTVLLTGETGTGKELVANAIHQHSTRASNRFVAINCGAIPSELMERELFGHEKGSFTGACEKVMGRLEYANGGTVFLDEIATLPLPLQVKLLRVIQEKKFERIGALTTVNLDVRFIAATNVNLQDEVRKGAFREDLYYRLNVVPIEIPPLRERKEDIPLLLHHFFEVYGKKYTRRIAGITNDAMDILLKYPWFGNIRELQNLTEMLVVLSKDDSQIDTDFLPSNFIREIDNPVCTYDEAVKAFEKEYILKILVITGWNRNDTAERLGMHRNTLSNKMKELGIQEAH